jgi:phage recombination protein Bet
MSNETTAVAVKEKQSVLVALGQRYSVDPAKLLDTLKNTVFKDANNEQLIALCIVSNEYKLNPFLKEIYAFPDKKGGIIPVVSVDGWISLINRQPGFDGVEFVMEDEEGKPYSVTAIIHVKGRSHPCKVTEYFSECNRNTDPWNKSPRRMLRHRALIQCGRVAFGLGGIADEEEVNYIKNVTPEAEKPQVTVVAADKPTEIIVDAPQVTAQNQLAEAITSAGFTFDDFAKWGADSGNIENEPPSFADIPAAVAKRLLKNIKGIIAQMTAAKEMAV